MEILCQCIQITNAFIGSYFGQNHFLEHIVGRNRACGIGLQLNVFLKLTNDIRCQKLPDQAVPPELLLGSNNSVQVALQGSREIVDLQELIIFI